MLTSRLFQRLGLLSVWLVLAPVIQAAAPQPIPRSYDVIMLPNVLPLEINASGAIITGQWYAENWSKRRVPASQAGWVSVAGGLNDLGVVAAYETDPLHTEIAHVISWDTRTNTVLRLPMLTPPAGSTTINGEARAINNLGAIAGHTYVSGFTQDGHYFSATLATLWQDGQATQLHALSPRGTRSFVHAINNRGQIVGSSIAADGSQRPVLWENGQVRDLGLPPGGYRRSVALAINDAGVAVGQSNIDLGDRATAWHQGQALVLTQFAGTTTDDSWALDINNHGHIVGMSIALDSSGNPRRRAAVWELGAIHDLNDFIDASLRGRIQLLYADTINDSGVIVGRGLDGGTPQTFVLLPRR